jgi:hypothetical protein
VRVVIGVVNGMSLSGRKWTCSGLIWTTLLLCIIVLSGIVGIPHFLQSAHGQAGPIGTICISQPSDVGAACGGVPTPPIFNGPVTTPATQIKFSVYINDSQPLNGFEVSLNADHNFLVPAGYDLTGNVFTAFSSNEYVVTDCLQGHNVTGPACPKSDTIDTFTLGVLLAGNFTAQTPRSGVLFTAIYNVTGTTPTGGISVGFQQDNANCVGESTGTANYCVDITNGKTGASGIDPENVQPAVFANDATDDPIPLPYLTMNTTSTVLTSDSGQTVTDTINANVTNGYPYSFATCPADTIEISAQTSNSSLTASVSPTTIGPSYPATSTLSITAPTGPGSSANYFVTLFGQYCTTDPNDGNFNDTLVATWTVEIVVQDYSLGVSPNPVSAVLGSAGLATVTFTSLNGFASSGPGTVSFTSSNSNQYFVLGAGYGVSACTTGTVLSGSCSVSLTPGTTATVGLAITDTTSTAAQYKLSVSASLTANGAADVHSSVLLIDWVLVSHPTATSVACSPSSFTELSPTGCTVTVTDTFSTPTTPTGTVSFTTNSTGTFGPTSTTCGLTAGGAAGTASCSVSYTPTVAGFHLITGDYGGDATHDSSSGSTTLNVAPLVPGFAFGVSSPASVGGGVSAVSRVVVAALGRFNGTVQLSIGSLPLGLSCDGPTPDQIILNSTNTHGNATVSCSSSVVGTFIVTVTGTSGSLRHSESFTVNVTSPAPPPKSPSILGLAPTTFYAVVGIGLLVIISLAVLTFRGRKRKARS